MNSSVTGSTLRLPKAQRRDSKIWFWSLFLSQEAIFSLRDLWGLGALSWATFICKSNEIEAPRHMELGSYKTGSALLLFQFMKYIFFYLNISSVQRIRFYQIFCFQSLNTFSFICERKFWNALSHTLRIQLRLRELHCRSRAVQCRSLVAVVNLNVDHS